MPDARDDEPRAADYRVARIAAAAAFVAVLAVLLCADVVVPGYDVAPWNLAALLAAIVTLLGLEARDLFTGGRK